MSDLGHARIVAAPSKCQQCSVLGLTLSFFRTQDGIQTGEVHFLERDGLIASTTLLAARR